MQLKIRRNIDFYYVHFVLLNIKTRKPNKLFRNLYIYYERTIAMNDDNVIQYIIIVKYYVIIKYVVCGASLRVIRRTAKTQRATI